MSAIADYDQEYDLRRKELLPKLFKVNKTLNQMMEDRGYFVKSEDKEINFEKWLEINKNKNSMSGIFFKKDQKNENVLRLYYEYLEGNKLNAGDINAFFTKMKEAQANSGIIIISGMLTSQATQKIVDINTELQIECFHISELIVNITQHELVPQHILLNEEEKKFLLQRYKIKESQLPKIMITDPIAKYLGLKRGNVVKIVRESETAGKYITYRIAS